MIRVLCLKLILIAFIENDVFLVVQGENTVGAGSGGDKEVIGRGGADNEQEASGKETTEDYQRHVIEDGVKSALFGSNSYDPIKQVFEPPPKKAKPGNKGDPASNSSSTVLGEATTPVTTEPDQGEKERKAFASASTTTPITFSYGTVTASSTVFTRQSVTTPGDVALAETTPTSSCTVTTATLEEELGSKISTMSNH